MTPASKRFYGILSSFILIIAAAVLLFTFILPSFADIQQLRGERASLERLVGEQEAAIATVERLLRESQSVSALQGKISLVLPTEESVPGVINQIQGIARVSEVTVESLNLELMPLRPASESEFIEPVGTMRLEIRLRGSYQAVKKYISLLETNIRIIDVDRLEVKGGTEGEILSYDLVVDTYYQR